MRAIEEIENEMRKVHDEGAKIEDVVKDIEEVERILRNNENISNYVAVAFNEDAEIVKNNYHKLLDRLRELKMEKSMVEHKEEIDWLDEPEQKAWLEKMQYTEKEDHGNKYFFLAIICGYKKMDNEYFQRLCDALTWRMFGDRLRMNMWIGGKVNWTVFYKCPHHINGHEVFRCGCVGEDNFSPEDWERDHDDIMYDKCGHTMKDRKENGKEFVD